MAAINVYLVSTGSRPHAEYVAPSYRKYLDCKVIHMTDMKTPALSNVDDVIRLPWSGHAMHFFIKCFSTVTDQEFMASADDVIVNGPLDEFMDGNHDVAICKYDDPSTKRRNKKYTNGLVLARHPDFYTECLSDFERIAKDDPSLLDVWGDMDCMESVIESGKYNVKFLPESLYCKKPIGNGDGGPQAVLWHYWGGMKVWMKNHGEWHSKKKDIRMEYELRSLGL